MFLIEDCSNKQERCRKLAKIAVALKKPVVSGCVRLHLAIEKESQGSVLQVSFSKLDSTSALNGLFTTVSLGGMVVGKVYKALDMVFPFFVGFLDRVSGLPT